MSDIIDWPQEDIDALLTQYSETQDIDVTLQNMGKRIADLEQDLAEYKHTPEAYKTMEENMFNSNEFIENRQTKIGELQADLTNIVRENAALQTKNKLLQTKLDGRREAYDRLMNQFLDIKQSSFRNDVATTDELARVSAENFSLKAELDEFKRPYKG